MGVGGTEGLLVGDDVGREGKWVRVGRESGTGRVRNGG